MFERPKLEESPMSSDRANLCLNDIRRLKRGCIALACAVAALFVEPAFAGEFTNLDYRIWRGNLDGNQYPDLYLEHKGDTNFIPINGNFLPIPANNGNEHYCLLYTSPSPRDATLSRMPSSA